MMAMSLGFVGLLFLGTIGRIEGLVLLVALAVFLYTCARGDVQLTALEEVQEQLGEATANSSLTGKSCFGYCWGWRCCR